jgi:uncharacterized protein involved in exopolysaccharide biosynthesis
MRTAIEILLRRRMLFVIPFAVVFAVPLLWSLIFMRSYEASSLIWLDSDVSIVPVLGQQSTASSGDGTPIQNEANTLQQLLQSRTFITSVIASSPLSGQMSTPQGRERTIAYVTKNLRTSVVGPNSLAITFFGRSPDEAVSISSIVTNEFLVWMRRAVHQQNVKAASFFAAQSASYGKELESARSELRAFQEKYPQTQQLAIADKVLTAPTINVSPAVQSEFQRLNSQLQYQQTLYDNALTDLAKTRVLGAAQEERYVNGLRVVDSPLAPTSFSKKRLLMFDLLAFMSALVVGAGAVVLAEITDVTARSHRDVEEAFELEVLAEVPANVPDPEEE